MDWSSLIIGIVGGLGVAAAAVAFLSFHERIVVKMKSAWFILLISALTDFVITVGTSLTSAMVATGSPQMPSTAVLVLSVIGGAVAAMRTIQQALKATPAISADLRGDPPPVVIPQQPHTEKPGMTL